VAIATERINIKIVCVKALKKMYLR